MKPNEEDSSGLVSRACEGQIVSSCINEMNIDIMSIILITSIWDQFVFKFEA